MFSNRMSNNVLFLKLLPLLLLPRIKERNGKARITKRNHDLKIQDLINSLANNKIAYAHVLALVLAHAFVLAYAYTHLQIA